MECNRLRVVFAGTPDFAATALQALLDSEHEVVGVLSQPDRPSGRGRNLTASPVKALALEHAVPVQQPVSLRDGAAVSDLAQWAPDVMVVAAFGLLLPATVLTLPALGCLNIHASLLPRWRGAAPIHRAILAGDEYSGVSIMCMDEGLDTGDVLLERRVEIGAQQNSSGLHDVLASLGAEALLEALSGYCQRTLLPQPQVLDGVTYAAKLDKSEAHLDFSSTAIELDRRIRAFNPWPVAETRLAGQRVRVWHSSLASRESDVASGEIIGFGSDGDSVLVGTGSGTLHLHELQKDGGKRVPAASLVRSLEAVGLRFGS